MKLPTTPNVKKLVRDPFVLLIAVVVMVPAVLVAFAIATQGQPQSAVNGARQELSSSRHPSTPSASTESVEPIPITEAEKPNATDEEQTTLAPINPSPSGPVCDQAKKSAAESNRNHLIAEENILHEQKKAKIGFVSRVTRRHLTEEISRHNSVLSQIEATFRSDLAAANC